MLNYVNHKLVFAIFKNRNASVIVAYANERKFICVALNLHDAHADGNVNEIAS